MRKWLRAIAWFFTPRMIRHDYNCYVRECGRLRDKQDAALIEIDYLLRKLNQRHQECEGLRLALDKKTSELVACEADYSRMINRRAFAEEQVRKILAIAEDECPVV